MTNLLKPLSLEEIQEMKNGCSPVYRYSFFIIDERDPIIVHSIKPGEFYYKDMSTAKKLLAMDLFDYFKGRYKPRNSSEMVNIKYMQDMTEKNIGYITNSIMFTNEYFSIVNELAETNPEKFI